MDEGITRVFNNQQAKASLGTKIIGRKIFAYDLVTSTNDLAHSLAQDNEPEGTVLFAKGQSQGRGRMGRTWTSPYDKGLYCSVILRPNMCVSSAAQVNLVVAAAVAGLLEDLYCCGISIKWPNDILLNDKKICGILTEAHFESDRIDYMVVGIGLNINSSSAELPDQATSLKDQTGKTFDIADLSHVFMKCLDDCYGLLKGDRFSDILRKVKEYSGLVLGGRVRVSWENNTIEGYAADFDEHGSLVLRRDNGVLEKISSGHLERL
ncbi:MAG: biotin--[acetyl-CoA-carboxylase] ligase [Candidatus Omnitrophota bacterium]